MENSGCTGSKSDQISGMDQMQNAASDNASLMSDFKWCDSATALMLKLYREKQVKFNNPHVKKKVVWREIADVMQLNGYAFDADRCERKFLNLKTSYRNTIQHNCMTGNMSRTCAFFSDLHEIFQKQLGLDENSSMTIQASPVRLIANANNVQVVSVSDGTDSRSMNSSLPTDQSVHQYSSQRQQGSQASSHHQTISERPSPHSLPNSSPDSFHVTASMFLEASAQRNSLDSSRHYSQGQCQVKQEKNPENHSDRRQSTHQSSSNYIPRNPSVSSPLTPTTVLNNVENGRHVQNTSVIDLCSNDRKRSNSIDVDIKQENAKKRKTNDLQNLLASFEKYREEQKAREDDRMKMMKEFHDEEMKVLYRFLDIIQHCVQNGSDD